MTEKTVSTAFMARLRVQLQDAVVIKHHDLGMIGLPDCSVTWKGLTLFLEFKLWVPTAGWLRARQEGISDKAGWVYDPDAKLAELSVPMHQLTAKAPVQLQTCRRLARAGHCLYVVWVKKYSLITFWDPLNEEVVGSCESTAQACEWVEKYLWTLQPMREAEAKGRCAYCDHGL